MNNFNDIVIHKAVGKIRENCVYAKSLEDVPEMLLKDGAVTINNNGSISLYAIEGRVERNFPVFICWEEVSAENADKVPGKFNVWPKDNGFTTLKVVGGKCYNLPSNIKASLITEDVPDWVTAAGFPIEREGDMFKLNRTDWGEIRTGRIGQALWCQYGEKDVNILDLHEKSAAEYIVSDENGNDIGILTDLIK